MARLQELVMAKYRVEGCYKGFSGTGYATIEVEAESQSEARDKAFTPGLWNNVRFIDVLLVGNEYTVPDTVEVEGIL